MRPWDLRGSLLLYALSTFSTKNDIFVFILVTKDIGGTATLDARRRGLGATARSPQTCPALLANLGAVQKAPKSQENCFKNWPYDLQEAMSNRENDFLYSPEDNRR